MRDLEDFPIHLQASVSSRCSTGLRVESAGSIIFLGSGFRFIINGDEKWQKKAVFWLEEFLSFSQKNVTAKYDLLHKMKSTFNKINYN